RRAEGGLRASRSRWEPHYLREKISAASLIRLRALRRRSETNNGLAIETRKRVELRTLFVRLALTIAIPQSGQCRIGGRDLADIGPGLKAAPLPTWSPRAGAGPPSTIWRRKGRTRQPSRGE